MYQSRVDTNNDIIIIYLKVWKAVKHHNNMCISYKHF